MARESPQTDRIVLLAQLLAAEPRTGRSLADIARHLGVAKATCYPMVVALTEAGWLLRHPARRTYQLGPALIGIGQAAAEALDVMEFARPLLRELSDTTSLAAIGFTQSGGDLVVAEITHPVSGRRDALGLRLGDRLRLLPPLGAALVAQLPSEEAAEWIADTVDGRAGESEQAEAHLAELALIQERGYAVECVDRSDRAFSEVVATARGAGLAGREAVRRQREILTTVLPTRLVGELDPEATYLPISISAATTATSGQPGVVLAVVDADEPLSGVRVAEIGEAVHEAAQRLSSAIS
ncbi:helix-turn-helix domain-containing protein [Nocardia higoensis]|uniref:helix-turn-helix domain-containing protein n=1 Tax=Nocardia higoensis TaxID=228599 RepID=UPI0002FB1248|nr:helix-turn-helix domain-containing protein [Nocardia higoensis]